MAFGIKDFTPEQLAKWQELNPNLYKDLGLAEDKTVSDEEFLRACEEVTEAWTRLAAATEEGTSIRERIEEAKNKPHVTPIQILGALIFLWILIQIIGGG